MPPQRTARPRAVTNENDENVVTRVTRAKAAAGENEINAGMVKQALQAKKTTTTTLTGAAAQRKRAVLGDVSNVKRADSDDTSKDAKKKPAMSIKPSNGGISKPGKPTTARGPPLGLKDKNKPSSTELKRPAPGSGVKLGTAKKRNNFTNNLATTKIREEEEVITIEDKPKVPDTDDTISSDKVEEQLPQDDGLFWIETADGEKILDLDKEDNDDPLMVSEYAVEIFEYLREMEIANMPNASYMDFQDHLTWKKRDMLNDWLIEVHSQFQLLPETFYLAINIIDRFLSRKIVQLDKLQLVGITAMFIASKYEEVMSPHVSNFTYLAQEYSDEEILSAERFVLQTLDYDLSYPNPMNFLRRISKADDYDMQTRTFGKYLLEIGSLDHRFLQYPSSQVAAAAMYFARLMLERGDWNSTIAHYAGYTEEELTPVFHLMVDYVTSNKVKHEAFHKKYQSRKYARASVLVRGWAKKNFPETIVRQNSARQTSSRPGADNVLGAADIKINPQAPGHVSKKDLL